MSVLDLIIRLLALLGLPTVTAWFLYDRRRVRDQAVESEATMPSRVRTSSVVSLEAEILALRTSFETDRNIKDQTIEWLKGELADARREITERDNLIDKLQEQLKSLRRLVSTITTDLETVQAELDSMRRSRDITRRDQ